MDDQQRNKNFICRIPSCSLTFDRLIDYNNHWKEMHEMDLHQDMSRPLSKAATPTKVQHLDYNESKTLFKCQVPGCLEDNMTSNAYNRHWITRHIKFIRHFACPYQNQTKCTYTSPKTGNVCRHVQTKHKHDKPVYNQAGKKVKKKYFQVLEFPNPNFMNPGNVPAPSSLGLFYRTPMRKYPAPIKMVDKKAYKQGAGCVATERRVYYKGTSTMSAPYVKGGKASSSPTAIKRIGGVPCTSKKQCKGSNIADSMHSAPRCSGKNKRPYSQNEEVDSNQGSKQSVSTGNDIDGFVQIRAWTVIANVVGNAKRTKLQEAIAEQDRQIAELKSKCSLLMEERKEKVTQGKKK